MTSIAEIFGDPAERADLKGIFRSEGFSTAWVLEDGDRAEFFFGVLQQELDRSDQRRVSLRLTEALPGRKAWVTAHDASGERVTLF